MSEPESQQATATTTISVVKVVQDIPVLFVDGVTSQAFAPGISKFYLHRLDSDPQLATPNRITNVIQVVMPVDGFVKMTAFFEHRLKLMVEAKVVTQESIDQARNFWAANPDAGTSSAT